MSDLELDCVVGEKGAYELLFKMAKMNYGDKRAVASRPIPDIAAKGLQLIKRFTTEWSNIHGVKVDKIFHFPTRLESGRPIAYKKADEVIDKFCDYIETPTDEHGKRWYLKSHEFRRFFAIVFFWQYKFASLTALQWMLGHDRPEHTYHYIREVVGGRAMTREEARFTADALRDRSSQSGLRTLEQFALDHFGTDDIALVESDDLLLYLENLLEEGVFRVRPHAIEEADGTRQEMVFEIIREKGKES